MPPGSTGPGQWSIGRAKAAYHEANITRSSQCRLVIARRAEAVEEALDLANARGRLRLAQRRDLGDDW
jgi:hypothetical protein